MVSVMMNMCSSSDVNHNSDGDELSITDKNYHLNRFFILNLILIAKTERRNDQRSIIKVSYSQIPKRVNTRLMLVSSFCDNACKACLLFAAANPV